jgi:hypothetical protein
VIDHVPSPLVHVLRRGAFLLNRLWHAPVSHAVVESGGIEGLAKGPTAREGQTRTRDSLLCHTDSVRVKQAAGVFLVLIVTGVVVSGAAERHWQSGTWKDMGIKRSPWVGGVASGAGPPGLTGSSMPEVGTYVI